LIDLLCNLFESKCTPEDWLFMHSLWKNDVDSTLRALNGLGRHANKSLHTTGSRRLASSPDHSCELSSSSFKSRSQDTNQCLCCVLQTRRPTSFAFLFGILVPFVVSSRIHQFEYERYRTDLKRHCCVWPPFLFILHLAPADWKDDSQ